MYRCIQLAKMGAGKVAPNPMVGAVLVYNDRIIGEGYHQKYGEAHAEVNCINSVLSEDKGLIEKSTLYVSLEPCSHFGKTPPCTDLIIRHRIKKVVIGCKDIYKEVAGRGIQKLLNEETQVSTGILKTECTDLNKRFFTYYLRDRPYIILKWAQSANAKIGSKTGKRMLISNAYSNRLVHKWRGEEVAILIGTNTALTDDPSLTTRLWEGKNPFRIVIDKELRLPASLKIFNAEAKTVIFNNVKNFMEENLQYIKVEKHDFLKQMVKSLFELNIQSVLIEGGSKTLQSFIDVGLWDEARVITNEEMVIDNGVDAPEMKDFKLIRQEKYLSDRIAYYKNEQTGSHT